MRPLNLKTRILPAAGAAALVLTALSASPRGAHAQAPLTLGQALDRAEQSAYANRIAAGERRNRSGQALMPLRGILPGFRVEAGYMKTTDPLNAFGFLLRQRGVSPAAFDPARLNNPDAIGNLSTGLVVEQPLFNADAWLGRHAAARAAAAARSAEEWTRATTATDVVRAYWGAVLAQDQVRTLEAAVNAAQAHVKQAEALVRQGMATKSDALLASVRSGEIESRLLGARSELRLARRGLAILMGNPSDTLWTLPEALPASEAVQGAADRVTADATGGERADVAAARAGQEAARANARRAAALYLPRLNGFGRLDWNSPDKPFNGQSSWTVGVMLTWSPFAGASELAERRAAQGQLESARAMAGAAEAQAELERSRAADAVELALARLAIADRTVDQAREAHRIVGRKYEGGLASVTEMLDAAAIETATGLGQAAARYDALVALASLRLARGQDLAPLTEIAS